MKIIRITSLFSLAMPLTLAAATITGTVTDGTTHKPAAGDDVVLIALTQKMQEVARTKADAKGRYSIQTPDDGMHLIRVDHQKAAYFQPAPPGTTSIDVQVYDVAATVPGITTEANVFRAETTPQGLRVTQSYFIKNDSTPPRTQFSPRSYEIYLPEGAQIQGAAAMGPGGMPVSSSPIPLGDPNHYAFVFPLRPGETQFQLSYSLPYSGSLKVMPKLATPVDNLVVILPKSMNFSAGAGSGFQPVDAGQTGQEMKGRITHPPHRIYHLGPRLPATRCPGEPGYRARRRLGSAGHAGRRIGGGPGGHAPRRRPRQSHRHARTARQIQVVDPQWPRYRSGDRGRLPGPPAGSRVEQRGSRTPRSSEHPGNRLVALEGKCARVSEGRAFRPRNRPPAGKSHGTGICRSKRLDRDRTPEGTGTLSNGCPASENTEIWRFSKISNLIFIE
jgi:hypothetical protein